MVHKRTLQKMTVCITCCDCKNVFHSNAVPLNLVNETNLVHYLFLVYFVNFIYNLYVFRTSPGPSSGGTAVFMRHLVLDILYSYTEWTWRGPKHVEVINKIDEIH